MEFNEYQSSLEELKVEDYPLEIQDQFFDFINNVPFIRTLVSKDRPRACDLMRDSEGKIIVDVTHPHILENMEYFRPSYLHYKKYGCFSKLTPNANKNSEYGKWFEEEKRRCREGYVRKSDGEWITGDMYFFLNYCPILLTKISKGSNSALRVWDFPEVWEGHYYKFHYIKQARDAGHHGAELASRSKGKSFSLAAMIARRFLLGELDDEHNREVKCLVTAYQKEYLTKDGILNKFQSYIDFCAQKTQFPARRLRSSLQDMNWKLGYIDLDTNTQKGRLNEVIGVSSKDDDSKLRGKRGVLIAIEEFGTFPNLLGLYGTLRPSVEEGDYTYGLIYMQGTAGDEESDFAAAQEIMYNPVGYNMHPNKNVYDKEGQGRPNFVYFFPAYLNRKGCFDNNGNSNVTKALLELLMERYKVKYNSTDLSAITKQISEWPITPQEAILRTKSNIFPVTELNERLNEIDNNPRFYNDTYVGELVQSNGGEIVFKPTTDIPIRDFPTKDNKVMGAIEIFEMPQKVQGKIPHDRYIASLDNYENDTANTMSLGSIFVLDLWTDRIVAEYTGRPMFSDDLNEIARKMCLFFNAKLLYEAHPYSQVVRTPVGNKLWEDIKVGDSLFAPNGNIVTVKNIPMDGKDDIYKITLQDGRSVEASSGHIWKVQECNSKEYKEVNTSYIFEKGAKNKHNQHNFYIPESGAVNYSHKDVLIDPYTLGLLIAEGTFSDINKIPIHKSKRNFILMSSSLEDMIEYKHKIPYKVKYNKGVSWSIWIDDIENKLRNLNLAGITSDTKFIPTCYIYNDYNIRLELLKGLMDGEGCASNQGSSIFTTTSEALKNDIILLCRSLGIKAWEQKSIKSCKMRNGNYSKKSYRIVISSTISIFNLSRKVKKQYIYSPYSKGSKALSILEKTAIESIEYVGRKKCKCVTVDSEDGLYLIGDYIVTHNCNKRNTFAYFSKVNSLYLLEDTPEYLRQKQLIKTVGYGNSSKGVTATVPIKNHGFTLIRDWLLKPVTTIQKNDEGEHEVTVSNLHFLKNRALIKELILFNPDINVDRVLSLVQLMIFRESKMVLCGGNPEKNKEISSSEYLGNDSFFTDNYDIKFKLY